MKKKALILALLSIGPKIACADSALDERMNTLALNSGCFICHHVETGSKGPNGMDPIGPNWQDVAGRYRGKKDVVEKLVQTVLQGSNDYSSHWKGKVSGLAMPPNAVAIKEADARKLVNWILQLKPN